MVVVTNDPYGDTEKDPMLGAASSKGTPQVDGFRRDSCADEAYKNMIGSMNSDNLNIADTKVALELLSTAVELRNKPLAQQCLQNLDRSLDKNNVLTIYSHISQLKMPCANPNDFTPSAPPIVENQNQRNEDWVQGLTDALTHKCLQIIDKNADYILRCQEKIFELEYSNLLTILRRDTLEVTKETLVYSTVIKWARRECRRRGLLPHPVNIKAVVRDLRYAPRYGLMSAREFASKKINGERGPKHSCILEKEEWKDISNYIKEKSKNSPVMELTHNMSRPRVKTEGKNHCSNSTTCDKFLLNFLICWSTVFD